MPSCSRWHGAACFAGAAGALGLAFALGGHWGGRNATSLQDIPAASARTPAADIATVLRYHAASSASRAGLLVRAPQIDWGAQPAPFKNYPAAPHIALPQAVPGDDGRRSLSAMLRAPGTAPALHLAALGQMLHLTAGVTARRGGLALQPLQAGDFAAQARRAALDQDVIGDAAVVLILSADSAQALSHGARGYRMMFLEAGLMSQRWLLSAVARKLGACPVGAFYDDEAAVLVKAPPGRWVLHFAALGRAAD